MIYRQFSRKFQSVLLGFLAVFLGIFYAHSVEPNWIEVKAIAMPLPHLSPEFSGYRVVQISDIHADRWMTAQRLARVVQRVNQLKPDLVVLTGDFVTRSAEKYAPQLSVLSKLHPVDKTLAVMGNHDAATNSTLIQAVLETAGVQVLNNQVATLARQSSHLFVAGVDDVWANRDRLDQVLAVLPSTGAAILLAHEPDFAEQSAATGRFDLELSGHSHGGQVKLPFVKRFLPPLAHNYPIGQYQVGTMIQYTNRGLGMSVLPVRFNCRPEITVLTLTTVG
ncbi:MAG: metallophosphoesterase [Thermosynechococcaceae cyanobacterium MS004]|nr:metallophosphoesterase [Thermosynechococcaceae cyanobacterium MS004]